MRHSAAFPNFANPREVRAYMHTVHDRYVHGVDLLPKARVRDPEGMARKSRDIARALFNEWQIIDDDNGYFDVVLRQAVERLSQANHLAQGQVISKVGRNAVNFAFVVMPGNGEQMRVAVGVQDRASVAEHLQEKGIQIADGRTLTYENGQLQPEPRPDGVIFRRSGAASIFLADSLKTPAAA